ncbi:YbbR domain-containing protein [Geomicrobium halophilum]|uniref:YbbR domain-containing protein n=1 Tax=Geomicrobium halophilum TaxID=549000 RepID=A0A841Q0V8_9BACL|nr:CdaR family protein [Geomicrobium halophilum]MBB6451372.1 YbbR domain-containing protein [Geomicrobium halophilum]
MDRLFNNHWFLRFTSLVIAFMLFLMVNMDEVGNQPGMFPVASSEQLTIEDVEVNAYYDEEDYAILEMEDVVDVQVSGTRSSLQLFQVTNPNYEVYVDLEGLGPGVHNVNVEHSDFPSGLNVEVVPDTIQVTLEERETAMLPVEVEIMNEEEIEEGYTIGDPEVSPEEVEVHGATSQLQDIGSLQAFIDVREADETITENVDVSVYGPYGEEMDFDVNPETVEIVVPITPPSTEVPLEVVTEGNLDDNLELVDISPETENVTIYGPLDVINDIDAVEAGPLDLVEITENETIELEVIPPEGVEYILPESINVEVSVENGEPVENDESASEMIEVPVDFDNVPEDVEVTQEEETLEVTISGEEEELEAVSEEEIRPYLDYEDVEDDVENEEETDEDIEGETGTDELPVHVEGPNDVMYETDVESMEVEITDNGEDE